MLLSSFTVVGNSARIAGQVRGVVDPDTRQDPLREA